MSATGPIGMDWLNALGRAEGTIARARRADRRTYGAFLQLGSPVIVATLVCPLALSLFGLFPSFSIRGLAAATVLLGLAAVFMAGLQYLRRRTASRSYNSGAANRLPAALTAASAQAAFLRSHAFGWASGLLAVACLAWWSLGVTLAGFALTGAALTAAVSNLAGALRFERTIYWLIGARRRDRPKQSLLERIRYVFSMRTRLLEDRSAASDRFASSLAFLGHRDAGHDGIPLTIPDFGSWPGQSIRRESALRATALPPVLVLGVVLGVAVYLLAGFAFEARFTGEADLPALSAVSETSTKDDPDPETNQVMGQENSTQNEPGSTPADDQQSDGTEKSDQQGDQAGSGSNGTGQGDQQGDQAGSGSNGTGQGDQAGSGSNGTGQGDQKSDQAGSGSNGAGQGDQAGSGSNGTGQGNQKSDQAGSGSNGAGQGDQKSDQAGSGSNGAGQGDQKSDQAGSGSNGTGQGKPKSDQTDSGSNGTGPSEQQGDQAGSGSNGTGQSEQQGDQANGGSTDPASRATSSESSASGATGSNGGGIATQDGTQRVSGTGTLPADAVDKALVNIQSGDPGRDAGPESAIEDRRGAWYADKGLERTESIDMKSISPAMEDIVPHKPHVPQQVVPQWMRQLRE